MSDPATIARQYLECFNQRDWGKMRSYLHDSYTYTGGDGQVQQGPEAGLAVAQMFAAAMSDAKVSIKNIMTSGNTAIAEFVGSGTQDGEFMGIPASNRRATMPVCMVVEIKDGKIVAEREYMDMAHIMQQLGVMPASATA